MHKKLLLTTFCALICVLCTNTNGHQETDEKAMSIDYEAEEYLFKAGIERNSHNFGLLMRRLIQKGKAKGRKEGLNVGYKLGYEDSDTKFFMPFFECFVCREKSDLEIYTDPMTKLLYENKDLEQEKRLEKLIFPKDIYDMITKNDDWIPRYEAEFSNRDSESLENLSNDPSTKTMSELVDYILKIYRNWYLIVTCKGSSCPQYVYQIQAQLHGFLGDHRERYENIDRVYRRFAAFMARGYKMMYVLRHKVIRKLRKRAEQNGTATFTDIFFDCVPDFYLPYEQFYFFSVVRRAIEPKINPLQYFTIRNNPGNKTHRKWTLIPYDKSAWCNVNKLREIVTTKITTYKFYPLQTTAAQEDSSSSDDTRREEMQDR